LRTRGPKHVVTSLIASYYCDGWVAAYWRLRQTVCRGQAVLMALHSHLSSRYYREQLCDPLIVPATNHQPNHRQLCTCEP
jgi:hypothetical protein